MFRHDIWHPQNLAYLAAGRCANTIVTGACKANATFTFAGQLTANDVVTVNGTAYTAKASGATGNQFNIGGALTNTLDNLATVLNASVDPATAQATYVKNGGATGITVTAVLAGTAGNLFTLAGTSAGATFPATLAGGVDPDLIDLTAETYALITTAGNVESDFALPIGDEGQEVTMYLNTEGAGSNAVVFGAFVGGSKITLDTAGKWFKAKFLNASWYVIANTGTLS